jgi:tetratricopeptide (TPR) repeat protein
VFLDSARGGPLCSCLLYQTAQSSFRFCSSHRSKEAHSLANTVRKKKKVPVKEMRFKHDPMVRFYDRTQDWLQERSRPVVIAVGVIIGVILLYVAGGYFFEYRKTKAQAAFAEALEKFNAPVQDSTSTTPTGKFYTDEQTKWRESAEAFERLASDYSGYYGSIGRYYAGISYLHFDQEKGISLLEQTAGKNEPPTSDLARLALAENYAVNGDTEKAISLYQQLLTSSRTLKPAVDVGLGRVYEKTGDTEKAVEAYLEAARFDRSSGAGAEAEKRLQALAPDRLKDLPVSSSMPVVP